MQNPEDAQADIQLIERSCCFTSARGETPVAMAVTLEPEGGVPAPKSDKYLVGTAL